METILWVLLCGMVLSCATATLVTQEKLYEHLMKEYNKDIIPLKNKETPVEVKIGLSLLAIKSFKDNVLTLDAWVELQWNDIRLVWYPEDYDDFNKIHLPKHYLWIPDITVYNQELTDHGTTMPGGNKAFLSADGTIFMSTPSRLSAYCKNNKTSYADSGGQFTCDLKLGSWVYDGFLVDVQNRSNSVDTSNYFASNEWELTNTSIHRNVVRYACCVEPYPDVTITFYIKRKEF